MRDDTCCGDTRTARTGPSGRTKSAPSRAVLATRPRPATPASAGRPFLTATVRQRAPHFQRVLAKNKKNLNSHIFFVPHSCARDKRGPSTTRSSSAIKRSATHIIPLRPGDLIMLRKITTRYRMGEPTRVAGRGVAGALELAYRTMNWSRLHACAHCQQSATGRNGGHDIVNPRVMQSTPLLGWRPGGPGLAHRDSAPSGGRQSDNRSRRPASPGLGGKS